MKATVELTAKRIILTLLGLAGLIPVLLLARDVLRRPGREAVTMLVVLVLGPILWLVLLPRWDRWPRLQSGNRVGILLVCALMTPPLLLSLAGAEHVEDLALVAGPQAVGVTSLWWALRGFALDA